MTKEEALDLALAALEKLKQAFFKNASTAKEIEQGCDRGYEDYEAEFVEPALKAITAIKKARALDKMAENARELGLDYEPAKYSDIVSDGGMDPRNQFDVPPTAQPAPVHKPYRPLQDNGSQYFGDSWDTPPSQPAPVAFEVGLVVWVGNKLMATPKVTTTPPASWTEIVTANLVREGVGKHKSRELAEHFYSLAQRPFVGLSDVEVVLQWSTFWEAECHPWAIDFARAIEAKLRSKNGY